MAVRIRQASVLDLDALAEMEDAAWRGTGDPHGAEG